MFSDPEQTTNNTFPGASLASSTTSESEPGGHTPPIRKRLGETLATGTLTSPPDKKILCLDMHQANHHGPVSLQNGGESGSRLNGDCTSPKNAGVSSVMKANLPLTNKDRDVVRIVGQYLRSIGLE